MTDELPAAARRVQAALRERGLTVEIVVTAESAHTAQDAAAALGVSVGQIVKSLVFLSGDEPILVLASGPNRVDTARLSELSGAKVRRADADAVRSATGFSIGGIPPLAHAAPLRAWCDRDLLAYEVVWAAAGTPHAVFPIAPTLLVELAGAAVADLAAR